MAGRKRGLGHFLFGSRQAGRLLAVAVVILAVVPVSALRAQDSIEFLNGTVVEGKLLEIRKADREFDFRTQVGGRVVTQTFRYDQVHAVVFGGKRFELTAKPEPKPMPEGEAGGDLQGSESVLRSRAEVLALIERAGETLPEWYESTDLDYPESLDLSWPLKPKGDWNSQKNVGQYLWDIVNPNERRWRSGIKLIHEILETHRDQPALLRRDQLALAAKYFELLQDYPRAAYWYQQAKVKPTERAGIRLAECYWRMGNREMALADLRGKVLPVAAVKLLGDLGEIDGALQVAEVYAKTQANHEALLAAGDALRRAGRLEEAIEYYQRVLDLNDARNEDYQKRFHARATGSIEAIRLFDQADISKVADGVYTAGATGYSGEVKIRVVVKSGRLESVEVTEHRERQFYSAIRDTTGQLVDKQSVREIDGTTGATITSEAIVQATAKALSQGGE